MLRGDHFLPNRHISMATVGVIVLSISCDFTRVYKKAKLRKELERSQHPNKFLFDGHVEMSLRPNDDNIENLMLLNKLALQCQETCFESKMRSCMIWRFKKEEDATHLNFDQHVI